MVRSALDGGLQDFASVLKLLYLKINVNLTCFYTI